MDEEIAELESFIDSYVGDEVSDPIPSEIFTNTNAKYRQYGYLDHQVNNNGYEHQYDDFEEELLQHQRKQESLKDEIHDRFSAFQDWGRGITQGPEVDNNRYVNKTHQDRYPPMDGWEVQYGNFHAPFVQNYARSQGDIGHYRPEVFSTPGNAPFTQNFAGSRPNQGHFTSLENEGLPAPMFPPYYPVYADWNNPPHHNLMTPPNTDVRQPPLLSHQKPTQGQPGHPNMVHAKSNAIQSANKTDKAIENGMRYNDNRKNLAKGLQGHAKVQQGSGRDEGNWRKSEHIARERPHSGKKNSTSGKNGADIDVKLDCRNSNKTPLKHEAVKKQSPQGSANKSPSSRHSSQSSLSESMSSQGSKVVSGRSKEEVRLWLRRDSKSTPIEKEMKKMEITKTNDLPKLIKTAQSYITSEKKMREVAEMVCMKAMKNPLFAQNGAILCNEMSRRMVNGTSFRTVVLNIVQGHYKNRNHIMMSSIKNPKDTSWGGFVTFLVELYLNLRTSSNERLKTLVGPVYDSLYQMVGLKAASDDIIKCFCFHLQKAGPALELADAEKMAELFSLIRDSCVMPNDLSTESRRKLLRVLESYARGWKVHPLDNAYFKKPQ